MKPIILAEISGNHAGNLQHCITLIEAAKVLGIPTKLQRFDPARLAKRRTGISWFGKPQTEEFLLGLYRETETPAVWWPDIIEALGTHPWSCSVFDQRDIDFMEGLDCPAYKIASYEMSDPDLIAAAARTKKPLTISIPRRASPDQIKAAVKATSRAPVVTFLYATHYFQTRDDYQRHFADEVSRYRWVQALLMRPLGLSDHSPPGCSLLAHYAVQWGAPMIERHLRLPGVDCHDAAFSLTPPEMDEYIHRVIHYAIEAMEFIEVPHLAKDATG